MNQMLPTNRLRLNHIMFSESALCIKIKTAIQLREEDMEEEEQRTATPPLDLPPEYEFPCESTFTTSHTIM